MVISIQKEKIMPKNVSFSELKVGQTASITKQINIEEIQQFANISEDFNPVHLDEEFAKTTRFGGRIAHGLISASFFSGLLGTKLPGTGTIYLSQSLKFKAPVKVGDVVTASVEITALEPAKNRATLTTLAKVGDVVVVEGEALVLVLGN